MRQKLGLAIGTGTWALQSARLSDWRAKVWRRPGDGVVRGKEIGNGVLDSTPNPLLPPPSLPTAWCCFAPSLPSFDYYYRSTSFPTSPRQDTQSLTAAFHSFLARPTRGEISRITKPSCWAVAGSSASRLLESGAPLSFFQARNSFHLFSRDRIFSIPAFFEAASSEQRATRPCPDHADGKFADHALWISPFFVLQLPQGETLPPQYSGSPLAGENLGPRVGEYGDVGVERREMGNGMGCLWERGSRRFLQAPARKAQVGMPQAWLTR